MDEMFFHQPRQHVLDHHETLQCRVETDSNKKKANSKRIIIVWGVAFFLVIFLAGLGLGFWSCNLKKAINKGGKRDKIKEKKTMFRHQDIAELIDRTRIEKNLRNLTQLPHNAGSLRNRELAEYVRDTWQNENGIESKLIRYNVLLSFPSKDKLSAVHLIDAQDQVAFTTQVTEEALEASERQKDILRPFAAYSPSGNITADMVYVNYGRHEDFQYLLKHNVSCEGKIVIVRYGENFRGDKVRLAHSYGALGVVVYSDPVPNADTYPRTKYLPCTGVQRGAFRNANGDPETPGYPSIDGVYRVDKSKQSLPRIPVYLISACDALNFLGKLREVIPAPSAWQGGLNVSYNIGPGFQDAYKRWKVRLEVYNEERREDVYNVIGIIPGQLEPDRRVILGNHRDAWVFGGVDPSGGTACLMEIGRALGLAMKNGWRPRRTIMLTSWGGEEYGMIGSTEYVEEFFQSLREEGVAYLNIDSPIRGNFSVFAKSSPMLYDVLYNAAKKVKNPVNNDETVFDQWRRNLPSRNNHPRVDDIATGSDYVAFSQHVGMSSAEIRYVSAKDNFGYPVYHSLHDTFHYVKTFIDPEFHTHRAIAQVVTHSLLALADDEFLPLNATKFAERISSGMRAFLEKYGTVLTKFNITVGYLKQAIREFKMATVELQKKIKEVNKRDVLTVRMLNDRLMLLEKGFISGTHVFGRQRMRHVLFGLDSQNSYKTVQFPGLVHALMQKTPNKNDIEKQMTILMSHIYNAANYIKLL
ncbi:putative N-acetylated-alpha-linked acidic dipeptidase [Dendronephthya gigantea]|uniref:putative N-acetylated-alpha-linked acidic dipeptidase n=1 Tax=Dendronephthya gigantea TaxID=151771 RepID=UPI00106B6C38|nr:putative N-acetylated-alpha-linked acidic dipeptidase [Dendronephthya gigantea]